MRGIPDVCGVADAVTGWYLYYLQVGFRITGGTSCVAPMWAAYIASTGAQIYATPWLYNLYATNPNIVHDITSGTDGAYTGAPGWDPASGLGSPNGAVLTPLLQATK